MNSIRFAQQGHKHFTGFVSLFFFFSYQLLIGGRFMIRKLGFAADDRLLIINADDFGMTKGTNEAIVNLFEKTQ